MLIAGKPGDVGDTVTIDGAVLVPAISQAILCHSPDGFTWGYGGSGPSQLALAILIDAGVPTSKALELHHDFKDEFVAQWPHRQPFAEEVDVLAWVRARAAGPEVLAQAAAVSLAREYPDLFEIVGEEWGEAEVRVRPDAEGKPCPCCGLPLSGSPLARAEA